MSVACPLPSPELTEYQTRFQLLEGTLLYMHVTQPKFEQWLGYPGPPYIGQNGAITNIKGQTVYAKDLIRALVSENIITREAITRSNETGASSKVKPGVEELFESNPELANSVYESLGFFDSKNQTSRITNEALYDVLKDKHAYDIDSLEYLLNSINDNFSLRLLRLFKGDKKFYINNSISEFGLYNAEDNTIHINTEKHIKNNPNNYNILETIVHELTHRFISFNILGLSQHNNEAKNIVNLFNDFKKIYKGNNKYALSSVDEFVSELLSNKVFQKELKEIPYKNSNIFNKFIDYLLLALNLKRDNLLSEAIVRIIEFKRLDTNFFNKFNNNIDLITPQQKQQAQQLYSQYLDTIFPDSKVKDIVYRGGKTKREYFKPSVWNDIYFSKYSQIAKNYAGKDGIVQEVILNITNPYFPSKAEEVFQRETKDYIQTISDGVIDNLSNEIVVFESEQIHILGNEQDVEGFKKFVKNEGNITQAKFKVVEVPNSYSPLVKDLFGYNRFNRAAAVKEILEQYAKTLPTRQAEALRQAITIIVNSPLFSKINFKLAEQPGYGGYSQYDKILYISPDAITDGKLGHTLLHELIHAATLEPFGKLHNIGINLSEINSETLEAIFVGPAAGYFSELEKRFLRQAFASYQKVKDSNHYGSSSAEEMIAEMFTDPGFFNWIVNKFKELIRSALEMIGFREPDMIDATIELIKDVSNRKVLVGGVSAPVSMMEKPEIDFKEIDAIDSEITLSKDTNKYSRLGKEYERLTHMVKEVFSNKYSEDYAKNIADTIFRTQVKDKATETVNIIDPVTGLPADFNYDQLINIQQSRLNALSAKGRIIHLMIEKYVKETLGYNVSNYDALIREQAEAKPDQVGIDLRTLNWVTKDLIREWFKIAGFNFFDFSLPVEKRDQVRSEVSITSDTFGVGTTIDLLVRHQSDGSYSIGDFKTGDSLYRDEMTSRVMNYSRIPDSTVNRSLLEIVIRAFMIKENIPTAKFKQLLVLGISRDFDDRVLDAALERFLPMLENYIKANHPDKHADLEKKGLFNPTVYYATSRATEEAMKAAKGQTAEAKLQFMEDIAIENAFTRTTESFSSAEREMQASQTITQLENETGKRISTTAEAKDMQLLARFIGNKYSASNPLVQAFISYVDKIKIKARTEKQRIMDLHNKYHDKILEEYYQRNPGKKLANKVIGGIQWFGNGKKDGLYDFMWENMNGPQGPGWYFRVITEEDVKTGRFTPAQYEYNNFIRTTMAEKYNGMMSKKIGAKYRYQRERAPKQLHKNFAPRVFITAEESIERHGFFSKENAKYQFNRYLSTFLENNFYNTSTNLGVPLKYLENEYNVSSVNHTFRVDRAFEAFVTNAIFKDELDLAYGVGKGVEVTLAQVGEKTYNNPDHYIKTKGFVRDYIKMHVQNVDSQESWTKDSIVINGKAVGWEKIMDSARNYVTNTTMVFKPVTGTFNMALIFLLNLKTALGGSIIGGARGADFTVKDFLFGIKEWTNLVKDSMTGNLQNNKLFNIAKVTNFLPDNYDYASHSSDLPSAKNKLLSKKYLFLFHSIGEDMGQYTMLAAMLHRMKGAGTKNMWEMYNDDGTINKDAGIRGIDTQKRIIDGLTSEEITRLKRISAKVHGGYRQDERTAIETNAIGRWAIQFKKYIPSLLETLGKSTYMDESLGDWVPIMENGEIKEETITLPDGTTRKETMYEWKARLYEGRLRTLITFMSYYAGGMTDPTKSYKNLTVEQKKNLADIGLSVAYFLTALLAKGLIFDDDEEDTMLYRRVSRFSEDLTQGLHPFDLARSLVNPFTTPAKLFQFSGSFTDFIFDGVIMGERTQQGNIPGMWTVVRNIPFGASYYDVKKNIIDFYDDVENYR